MRRPSLTDLYAGRPGVPSRRRNRAAEALSGAARGLQRGLAFQDRETDSDDDQDVLPSTTLDIEIIKMPSRTPGTPYEKPESLTASSTRRRRGSLNDRQHSESPRSRLQQDSLHDEDGFGWQDLLFGQNQSQLGGILGGGQGLLGGLLGGGLLASLPFVIKKLLDKKKTDTDETDSLG
jgi:hypothetical protein